MVHTLFILNKIKFIFEFPDYYTVEVIHRPILVIFSVVQFPCPQCTDFSIPLMFANICAFNLYRVNTIDTLPDVGSGTLDVYCVHLVVWLKKQTHLLILLGGEVVLFLGWRGVKVKYFFPFLFFSSQFERCNGVCRRL